MDIEQQQSEVLQQFVKQAGNLEGASLAALLIEATSHPSLFAFSEILSVPNLSTLEGTQYSSSLDLLRLFAYGTWTDYKSEFLLSCSFKIHVRNSYMEGSFNPLPYNPTDRNILK
ncbi:COP9 signalosome complex subunit 7-like [Dendrobium catenatum]|uniref:COP9 signalosome complex subunit 7-like n=1 Tax=Dendrobium catenatum TaxID=906689 RepID=UPI00109FE745|nr:COP9 signalosome complex subunit 7-like [Dendrobium catenatum]